MLTKIIANRWLLVMAMPAILLLLVFNYFPMFGLILAFKEYSVRDGILGSKFIGLTNFKYLFSTNDALRVTLNTISLNFLFIVVGTFAAIFVAVLMSEVRSKYLIKFYQSALFLPYFVSWVIVSYLAYTLLSYDMGMLNKMLTAIGGQPIQWYSEPRYWPVILTIANMWKYCGYYSLIYYAGITCIDAELYEASKIDGASKVQQIIKITIPLIMPLMITLTLLSIGRILFADFGMFYNVTLNSGMLYKTTDVIDTYVFRALRATGDIGMASAAGFYQAIFGFILVLASNYVVRKIQPDRAMF